MNRRVSSETAMALTGICAIIFTMVLVFMVVDASPSFGLLNGCEAYPTECAAWAEERIR